MNRYEVHLYATISSHCEIVEGIFSIRYVGVIRLLFLSSHLYLNGVGLGMKLKKKHYTNTCLKNIGLSLQILTANLHFDIEHDWEDLWLMKGISDSQSNVYRCFIIHFLTKHEFQEVNAMPTSSRWLPPVWETFPLLLANDWM